MMREYIARLRCAVAVLLLVFCLVPAVQAVAAPYDPFADACKGQSAAVQASAACQADGSDPITGKNGALYKTSRVLALVAAIAAVILIMVGGLFYITASGDASKVKEARSIIVSAAIGLVIIGLAELIVTVFINLVN